MRCRITTSGNSAALLLPQDILGLMEVGVGDKVEVTLVDRSLVVRPVPELDRQARVSAAIDDVFRKRKSVLRRLSHEDGAARVAKPNQRRAKRKRG